MGGQGEMDEMRILGQAGPGRARLRLSWGTGWLDPRGDRSLDLSCRRRLGNDAVWVISTERLMDGKITICARARLGRRRAREYSRSDRTGG